jgi:excisionase family DNA binding protein
MFSNLMSSSEAAAFLCLTKQTVQIYAASGRLTGAKIGRRWRFSESALQDFVDANRIK